MSENKRKIVSAASTALVGVAAGALGGIPGMALGAVVGAAVGLIGPSTKSAFVDNVSRSIERAEQNDSDLGHQVGNKYRDIIQGTGVGGLAGMRGAWDAVVS